MNPTLEEIDAELARRGLDQNGQPLASSSPVAPPEAPGAISGAINTAGNMATAASQGLIRGIEDTATSAHLALRNYTDGLGLTSIADTKKERQLNDQQNALTEQSAKALGAPTTGAVAKVAGNLAPYVVGGAIMSGAGIATGAGALGQAASGAIQAGLTDAGGGILNQLENTALGSVVGGILGKAGKYLGSKFNLQIDPGKAEAYRAGGIVPRASQVASDPTVAAAYANIEKSLATMPGKLGLKGQVGKQGAQFEKWLPQIVGQLDGDAVKSAPLFAKAVDSPAVNAKTFVSNTLAVTAKDAFKNLESYGKEVPDVVRNKLAELAQRTPSTMKDLQESRMMVSEIMNGLKSTTGPAAQKAFYELNTVRQAMSGALDKVATANGVKPEWQLANQAWTTEHVINALKPIVSPADGGLGSAFNKVTQEFDPKAFLRQSTDALRQLKEQGFKIPPEVQKAIASAHSIGADLFGPNAAKVSKTPIFDAGNLLKTGMQAAGAYAAVSHPATAVAAGTISLGLSQLVSTPTGIKLLAGASGKGLGHEATRAVLTTAAALGAAKTKQMLFDQTAVKQPSLEEIDAELARRGLDENGNPIQQGGQ
jgi:hypothetical protein